MTDKEKKAAEEIADADLDDATGGIIIINGKTQRTARTLSSAMTAGQDANTVDGSFSPDALDVGETPPLSFSLDLDKTKR